MNKFGIVLGVAAVATLAGCKDPDYKHANSSGAQNEVKTVDTTVSPAPSIKIETVETPKCKCPPGTRHTTPCKCGAPDCFCIVEAKVVAPKAEPIRTPEAETTVYVVQSGDYLAKISKKFNVTISSIKRANPQIKNNTVRVGQKLNIPGRHAVPATVVAAPSVKSSAGKAKGAQPFTGATKEYVVKNGDTLGAIAYGNGCTIRQLKELNGLTKDSLRIGQKLKIPAAGKASKKASASAKKDVAKKPAEKKAEAPKADAAKTPEAVPAADAPKTEATPAAAEAAPTAPTAEAPKADAAKAPETAPAPAQSISYVVQEGDDMTGVSIRFGVSAAVIRELNNLPDGAQLTPGQVIKLPADAQQ